MVLQGAVPSGGGVAAVRAVVGVVVLLAEPEQLLVRGLVLRRVRGRGAELLAELERAEVAVFNAEAAGDALLRVHLGDVVGADDVRGLEVLGYAQGEAGAAAAVADSRRAVGRVEVRNLVHEAVLLAALEYLVALLAVYLAAVAGADVVLGGLVEEDADVLLQVAAALAHEAARPAAGAVRDGDGVALSTMRWISS